MICIFNNQQYDPPIERACVNDDSVHANDWRWPETPTSCAKGPKETGTGQHDEDEYEDDEGDGVCPRIDFGDPPTP